MTTSTRRHEILRRLGSMRRYVVKSGDHLSKIAADAGCRSWRELYDHPCNAELREKHPDPDRIQPGTVIHIPVR